MSASRSFFLAALLALASCTPDPQTAGPREKTTGESIVVEVNSKAPGFAARTLDGGTVRLADLLGRKVVLLEFWSIFCKSCIEEMPHIEALHERYGEDGLAVLSVNTDVFSSKRVSSFLDKVGIAPPYPILRDPRQELVESFGVELLPVTVILDRDGWIRLYQEGYRPGDERRFERKVRSLLGRSGSEDTTLATRGGVTRFAPAGTRLVEPGARFDQLRARTLAGEPIRLGNGKPHLLYFWSLYCNPCRKEYPAVASLAERYAARGLRAVSVNVDSERLSERVSRFAGGERRLPCVLDAGSDDHAGLAESLGVAATPTLVLLDETGTVVHVASGRVDPRNVAEKIAAMLGDASF